MKWRLSTGCFFFTTRNHPLFAKQAVSGGGWWAGPLQKGRGVVGGGRDLQ